MIWAYFRMKLLSLNMNNDLVFDPDAIPGRFSLVALLAAPGRDDEASRVPPPRPPPSSAVSPLSADRFVILTKEFI